MNRQLPGDMYIQTDRDKHTDTLRKGFKDTDNPTDRQTRVVCNLT